MEENGKGFSLSAYAARTGIKEVTLTDLNSIKGGQHDRNIMVVVGSFSQ